MAPAAKHAPHVLNRSGEIPKGVFAGAPPARAGMRIGIMGGSFDPPHKGHLHITEEAIKRLRLDAVWWLVSPGNPLKQQGPWPLAKRLEQTMALVDDHPKIRVSALEQKLGSSYTAETLGYLTRRFPSTRFVWLMGGDNLVGIHHWRDWKRIFKLVPIAVLDRPGSRFKALASPAAHVFRSCRLPVRQAALLANAPPPRWTYMTIPLNQRSSTAIRQRYRGTS
jgi:nicotinate-nucleotide adenylyltransferase